MRRKIFKAGKYSQGNYSLEDIKKSVEISKGLELPVIFGHWTEYSVKTAIPLAGVFKNFMVEDSYITADVEYNDYGNDKVSKGAYTNYSIGFGKDNKIHHLALLGAMPPAVKDLDSAMFSEEETDGNVVNIEFSEDSNNQIIKGENAMKIEEILLVLKDLSLEDKIKLVTALAENVSDDERVAMYKLLGVSSEYSETKESTEPVKEEFSMEQALNKLEGISNVKEEVKELVKEEVKKEFSMEDVERLAEEKANNKIRLATEKSVALSLVKSKVLPAYHSIFEYAIENAVNDTSIKEFSEGNSKRQYDVIIDSLNAMNSVIDVKEFAVKATQKNQEVVSEISRVAEETRKSFKAPKK